MPVPTDITAGTISISGSTVTGVGTSFEASDIRQGDLFIWIEGGEGQWSPIVQTVTSNTVLTLAEPWTGPTISGARYRLRYQWDSSRVSAQSRQLIEMLDNGNVLALAGLTGPGVPVFDGPHSMTVQPVSDFINGVAYDVQVDTLADRAAYDGQAAGFAVLVSDVGDGRSAVYSKASNTSGDWTDPAYVTGPVGEEGPEGPQGTPGSGFNWVGEYDSGQAYVTDDVVRDNGSTFIAIQDVPPGEMPSGVYPPIDTAYWQVIAVRGANGDIDGVTEFWRERILVDSTAQQALTGLGITPFWRDQLLESSDEVDALHGIGVRPPNNVSELNGRVGDIACISNAINGGSAKVVFWGDSVLEGVSQIDYSDSLAGLIPKYLRKNVGSVAWTFENYSIAGTNSGQAANPAFLGSSVGGNNILPPVPELWPAGDTPSKSWREWVRDSAPDLLFIAFGMNAQVDPEDHAIALRSMLDYTRTFTKVPSVVIVTPVLSTRSLPSAASPPDDVQNAANVARSIATEYNVSLADANALYRLHLDGVDIINKRKEVLDGFSDYTAWTTVYGARPALASGSLNFSATGRVDSPNTAQDFEVSVRLSLANGTIGDLVYRGSETSPDDAFLVRVESLTGGTVVRWYSEFTVLHLQNIPFSTTYTIIVRTEGARHSIWVNGIRMTLPNGGFNYERTTGGKTGIAVPVGSGTASRFTYRVGYAPDLNSARYTEAELLGINDWGSNPLSIGGSGVNHPSTISILIDYFASTLPLLEALQDVAASQTHVLFDSRFGGATAPNKIIGYTENLDVGSNFDPVNGRFTAPTGGYYRFDVNFLAGASSATVQLFLNGALNAMGMVAGVSNSASGSFIVQMQKGHYVELFATGGIVEVDPRWNHFSGSLIR